MPFLMPSCARGPTAMVPTELLTTGIPWVDTAGGSGEAASPWLGADAQSVRG